MSVVASRIQKPQSDYTTEKHIMLNTEIKHIFTTERFVSSCVLDILLEIPLETILSMSKRLPGTLGPCPSTTECKTDYSVMVKSTL